MGISINLGKKKRGGEPKISYEQGVIILTIAATCRIPPGPEEVCFFFICR